MLHCQISLVSVTVSLKVVLVSKLPAHFTMQ